MAVVKVAAHCNLYCTYCHWFRDPDVESKPPLMRDDVQGALFARLQQYIEKYRLTEFTLCLHGGEPLLLGKRRLRKFCEHAQRLQDATGARIDLSITTNGVLIDSTMAALLRELDISTCVSVDGPKHLHDACRVDRKGRGSFDDVLRGLGALRDAGLSPTALCVGQPAESGSELLEFFVDELNFRVVDFLLPDWNRDDLRQGKWSSMSSFLISLFDRWYDEYSLQGVRVRLLEAMIASILGRKTGLQGVGFSPMCVLSVNSDGSLENHDALRISGDSSVRTDLNILTSPIDALFHNRVWRAPLDASLQIPAECGNCKLKTVCRGGDVIHRYAGGRYDHASAYCSDYKKVYPHIAQRVREDLLVAVPTSPDQLSLRQRGTHYG